MSSSGGLRHPPSPRVLNMIYSSSCWDATSLSEVYFIANSSAYAPAHRNGSRSFVQCGGNACAAVKDGPSTIKSSILRFVAAYSSGKRSCDGWGRSANSSRTAICPTDGRSCVPTSAPDALTARINGSPLRVDAESLSSTQCDRLQFQWC